MTGKVKAVVVAVLATLAVGAASASPAQATSFCYVLVAPYSACPYQHGSGSTYYSHTMVLADYDGGGAGGVSVCARANYQAGGYLRDCAYNYKYIYPNGCKSQAIVGNNSGNNHTIKGEENNSGGGGPNC